MRCDSVARQPYQKVGHAFQCFVNLASDSKPNSTYAASQLQDFVEVMDLDQVLER
jgi:hypothetical protein